MLDPFTCLSLATAIVQFLDFGAKLLSEAKEIHQNSHGSTKENREQKSIVEDLNILCVNLQPAVTLGRDPSRHSLSNNSGQTAKVPLSPDAQAMQKLAKSCQAIADEMLPILEMLVAKNEHSKRESLKIAFLAAMKKDKIESLRQRLSKMQTQINSRLLYMMSSQQADIANTINELAEQSRRVETRITQKLDTLQTDFKTATDLFIPSSTTANEMLQRIPTISSKLLQFQAERDRVKTALKILHSLEYSSMHARHANVKNEHAETFRWIFEKEGNPAWTSGPPRFAEWLESEGGIYWIAGKAGSGKSTLMKYLWSQNRTRASLKTWAKGQKLITASHFFWSAGSTMQKSQVGLLRALLSQTLRQLPDLIHYVFKGVDVLDDSISEIHWDLRQLRVAFERLSTQQDIPVKMCFFIDGLDEYDGHMSDIISIFQKFTDSEHIKVCLSSRPWNIFEDAFGGEDAKDRKLMLQDLTQPDIKLFIHDKLEENYRFRALAQEDERYKVFIEQIVDKSQGVFLWVVLVVQSILDGLVDGNDISILQKRVDLLPGDLEEFFKHILRGIDAVYKPRMAQIFQLAVHSRRALSLIALRFIDQEDQNPNYAVEMDCKPVLYDQIIIFRQRMHKHLNACCKGLLEVTIHKADCFSQQYQVDFLHRTVRDFLKSSEMDAVIKRQVPPGFNVDISLSRLTLALLKSLPPDSRDINRPLSDVASRHIDDMFHYIKQTEIQGRPDFNLLEELDRCYASLRKDRTVTSRPLQGSDDWQEVSLDSMGGRFLQLAIKAGLDVSVDHFLQRNPDLIFELNDPPFLGLALKGYREEHALQINEKLIKILLDHGASPNERTQKGGGLTVMTVFLGAHIGVTKQEQQKLDKVALMLLEAGGDPLNPLFANPDNLYSRLGKRPLQAYLHNGPERTSNWFSGKW